MVRPQTVDVFLLGDRQASQYAVQVRFRIIRQALNYPPGISGAAKAGTRPVLAHVARRRGIPAPRFLLGEICPACGWDRRWEPG
jgi:hypothetical protein